MDKDNGLYCVDKLNFAGRLARACLKNPLTPIGALLVFIIGVVAFLFTPREENPQIDVPSAAIIVVYPGASSEQVQKVICEPLSRKLNELTGVDHTFGMAKNSVGMVTVQFKVGENKEKSLLKLYDRVMQNMDILPKNAMPPLVKPIDIDEVPIFTVALASQKYSQKELYTVARELLNPLASVKNVSVVGIKGGQKRQLNVLFDPGKLASYGLSGADIAGTLSKSSLSYPLASIDGKKESVSLSFDGFIKDANDLGQIIIANQNGRAVYLFDVAKIEDGVNFQDKEEGFITLGNAYDANTSVEKGKNLSQATVFVAKKRGANAVFVANDVSSKLDEIKKNIPDGIGLVITRNDGAKANHVVNELMFHLGVSIAVIVTLLLLMLGRKEALIVSITIPLVFAVTLFAGMMIDQTINRITLFALILSLGLLVDDAIVVMENIHRHFQLRWGSKEDMVIVATNEVGNPTYIATIAVVLAFVPMVFVTGMMGPYMGPIPFNVPVAMLSSLVIAFAIAPYLAYRLLDVDAHSHEFDIKKTKTSIFYEKFVRPMLLDRKRRYTFMYGVIALFFISLSLPYFQLVKAKMLPGSNVNTFNITIDNPVNASIEETKKAAMCVGNVLKTENDIKDFETFVGTTGIIDFNGLLRGGSVKKGDNVAEIRVNLRDKSERKLQSGEYVSALRPKIKSCEADGANVRLVEDPPGPPVLATLSFEIYGGAEDGRRVLAEKVHALMKKIQGVVDTDILGDKQSVKYSVFPDKQKASAYGISSEDIALALNVATMGKVVGVIYNEDKDPTNIFVRSENESKNDLGALSQMLVRSSMTGKTAKLGELATVSIVELDGAKTSKDLQEVSIVTGEMDKRGSVYAQFETRSEIGKLEGYESSWDGSPRLGLELKDKATGEVYHIVFDGEWKVTFDTFRDLGGAFGLAVVLIYFLMVAYYGNFRIPGIILTTVPLTLIGIMPGHFVMNALVPTYFTATSMIGFIALAGIVVRNAIMLVDFTNDLLGCGKNLNDAIIEAAVTRFRPIMLTALAIALASLVIVLDPVWQGLAVSLIFGVMIATILTLIVTPLLYWRYLKNNPRRIDDLLNGRS
jgi:multidrug efflux pump subunit AcrB